MANTRFKTENGLLVTGGNAQFAQTVFIGNTTSRANLYVDGDLVHISGNLVVTGATVTQSGQNYTGDILAGTDGINLGNTTNRFDLHGRNIYVYGAIYPDSNTIPSGNTTKRWVLSANTIDVSGNIKISTIGTTNGYFVNNATIIIGNNTANAVISGSGITISGLSGLVPSTNTLGSALGTSTQRWILNANTGDFSGLITGSSGLTISGTANVTASFNVGGGVSTTNGTSITNTSISVGNTDTNVSILTSGVYPASNTKGSALGTSTQRWVLNANTGNFSGLITGSSGATITGTANVSASFNVGAGVSTTNGTSITNTSISVGNTDTNVSIVTTGVYPASNTKGSALGTSTQRWILNANTGDFSGLITGSSGATITGTINATSSVGVGTIGVTNGVSITSNQIRIGNNSVSTNIGPGIISGSVNFDSGTLFVDASADRVSVACSSPTNTFNVQGTTSLNGNTTIGGNLIVSGVSHTFSGNSNFAAGGLFVDAYNGRIGIGTLAPTSRLEVNGVVNLLSNLNTTGAVALSNTLNATGAVTFANTLNTTGAVTFANALTVSTIVAANIQGNANVGGTLGVNGAATFANVIVLNDQSVLPVAAGGHVTLRAGRNHESAAAYIGLLNQAKVVNTAMTAGRTHLGIRSELVNESRNLGSDGITQYNVNYAGFSTVVYNGNNVTGGNARAEILYGVSAAVENWANGALANTVDSARAGEFAYRSRGSGVATNAYGVNIAIAAANNSVTGNITTAYGVSSVITSNTAMTIGTGYLYYGDHNGTTTTTKYGLYLTGESNNYISGNLSIGGTVSGKFSGNGQGLTSTTYVSSYALATDTNIFVGGDSNTWKLGATYTPTVESGVSTLDVQVYAELYFKQFSDNVPTSGDIYANASSANIGSLDIGFGGGNPLMRYRVTKTYSGGNTTLYTSDYITISAAGTIAAQLNTIRDTTPTAGNGTTYRMEYEWVPVSNIPTGNLGTVSITSGSQTLTGSGTEFQGWVNPRNTITVANSTNGFGTGSTTHAITQVRGPTSILLTSNALDTRSGRFFQISDPYANVNMSQQYLSFNMTGYK